MKATSEAVERWQGFCASIDQLDGDPCDTAYQLGSGPPNLTQQAGGDSSNSAEWLGAGA